MIISIDLSKIGFDNDCFRTDLGNGEYLVFNRMDEDCGTSNGRLRIDEVVISHVKNLKRKTISNVIGVKNGKFRITSSEKSVFGSHLTPNLMMMCRLEIDENG